MLKAYIRSKIRISRELPHASKVFASEIMHGAPHLSAEQTAHLNEQARHNIACIQGWIDQGLMARIDPSHLLFSIWAATQTYADFDWQISVVTGRPRSATPTTKPPPTPSSASYSKAARCRKPPGAERLREPFRP